MRHIVVVWLIAIFSLTSRVADGQPAHLVQAETPITFDAYWELVGNTRQSIVALEALTDEEIRQKLEGMAVQWEKVKAVEFPDRSVMPVDSSYLAAELRVDPPDLKRLGKLLDALLGAHTEYPQNVFTIQDIEPLKKILARPEFQWQEGQTVELPGWLAGFFDWLARIRDRILGATLHYGRTPFIVAAVIIFIVSLYFIMRNLSRNLVREAQLAAGRGDDDDLLTSNGAMQRAQTLSGLGDYRNAIRYLYLSSLLVLDEQGLLRYDRSRTNREYLRSIASQPKLAEPLREVIDVFDRVWYGFDSVDEATYQSYVKHVDDLREKQE